MIFLLEWLIFDLSIHTAVKEMLKGEKGIQQSTVRETYKIKTQIIIRKASWICYLKTIHQPGSQTDCNSHKNKERKTTSLSMPFISLVFGICSAGFWFSYKHTPSPHAQPMNCSCCWLLEMFFHCWSHCNSAQPPRQRPTCLWSSCLPQCHHLTTCPIQLVSAHPVTITRTFLEWCNFVP